MFRPHKLVYLRGGFILCTLILFALNFFKFAGHSYDDTVREYAKELEQSATNHTIVDPPTTTSAEISDLPYYKFIVVTKSAPESTGSRNLLREKSWLSYEWKDEDGSEISWRHFFLLGLSVDYPIGKMLQEKENYGDIIIAPTLDGYTRMTYKLLEGFKILLREYRFSFLVVQSEDTLVNVKEINKYFDQMMAEKKDTYFYGGVNCFVRPANRHGPWEVKVENWSPKHYPEFCLGTGLIFSFDTVEEMARIWQDNKDPIVGLDDAHIGVLAFLSLGKIKMTTVERVGYGCQKNRGDQIIVTQIQPLEKSVELMQNYMTHGVYCFEDIRAHS